MLQLYCGWVIVLVTRALGLLRNGGAYLGKCIWVVGSWK